MTKWPGEQYSLIMLDPIQFFKAKKKPQLIDHDVSSL